jgi:serine/threonine protein kinase
LLQVQADLLLGLLQLDFDKRHEGVMQVRGATYSPDGTITVYCEDCGSMTIIDYMRSMFPQDMEEYNPHCVRLAVQLMLQASEAMSFADIKLGCLMTDCKPDDILVTPSGQVKHIDPTLVPLDSRDNLYGTPGYGAPEVMVQLFARKLAGHYFHELPDADILAEAVLNDDDHTSPAYKALAKYCNIDKGHLLTSKAGTYSMGSILFELCLPGLAAEAGRAKELLETHEQLRFVASICEEDATSLAGAAMSWERDVVVQPQLIRRSALVDALQEAIVGSMKVDPEERMSLEEFMACLRTAIRQLDQQIAALESSKQEEQQPKGGEEEEESKQQEVAAAVASCDEVQLAEPQLLSIAAAAAGDGCKHDTKAATIAACMYCAPEEVEQAQVQQRGFSDSAAGAAHTTCDSHNSSSSMAVCSKPVKQEEQQQQDEEGVVDGTSDSFTSSSSTPSSGQVLAKGMQLLLATLDLNTSSSSPDLFAAAAASLQPTPAAITAQTLVRGPSAAASVGPA